MEISNSTSRKKKLKPLKITCTSADCDNDLHCFKKTRQMSRDEIGQCRYCGADLIDWDRVHNRSLDDADYVFNALKFELVRHHFWHKPIDQKAKNHARRKGRIELRKATLHRLRKYIGPSKPSYDGRQTPWEGNLIFYAQHALACCCRTCLEYWHGVEKGKELTEEEIQYFGELIMRYVEERLPDLQDTGIFVPPLKRE